MNDPAIPVPDSAVRPAHLEVLLSMAFALYFVFFIHNATSNGALPSPLENVQSGECTSIGKGRRRDKENRNPPLARSTQLLHPSTRGGCARRGEARATGRAYSQ